MAALVAVLWAYEGWHVVSFAGGEMRRPGTDLPRSLGFGTLIILGLYVLANTSYYTVLTPAEIGSNPAVAAVATARGPVGARRTGPWPRPGLSGLGPLGAEIRPRRARVRWWWARSLPSSSAEAGL